MRALVIGTGAAGNKAVINLLEKGIIVKEDMLLVNSTLHDIPEMYRDISIQLSLEQEGCGQERELGKKLTYDAISNNKLSLKRFVQPVHEKIIVVSSTDGGSGSGSVPIICTYCKVALKMPVEVYGLIGVGDSSRSLGNSIDFFTDLDPSYIVQTISNEAFMKAAGNNKMKANRLANDELVTKLRISLGQYIFDSEQNIDKMDLYKLNNTSGYTVTEYREINEKIKSTEQFNKILKDMIDESKSLDSNNAAMVRLGVICNLNKDSQDFIDYSYSEIKTRLGKPHEVYSHIQDEDSIPQFIAFIAVGMKLPIKELVSMKAKFDKEYADVNKDDDDFHEMMKSLRTDKDDDRFNMVRKDLDSNSGEQEFLTMFDFGSSAPTTVGITIPKATKGKSSQANDAMGDF